MAEFKGGIGDIVVVVTATAIAVTAGMFIIGGTNNTSKGVILTVLVMVASGRTYRKLSAVFAATVTSAAMCFLVFSHIPITPLIN